MTAVERGPDKVWDRVPRRIRELLQEVAAASEGDAVYLVGGTVRDLLLGRESGDVDLVVLGDAVGLARRAAQRLAVEARVHPEFGTATLRVDGLRVDVATARKELYDAPAALPTVQPGGLEDDLARRDFSVNAMALEVTPSRGAVVDPYGGRADLKEQSLRLLHARSIRDDPTRALRGVRLEQQLDFRMDAPAEEQIREALRQATFDRLSGTRLRDELERTLAAASSFEATLARLGELGLLRAVHPDLIWSRDLSEQVHRAQLEWSDARASGRSMSGPLLALVLLALQLPREAGSEIAQRLALRRGERRALSRVFDCMESLGTALVREDTRALVQTLDEMTLEQLVAGLAVAGHRVSGWRDLVWRAWDHQPVVRPSELLASGCPEGPELGEVLLETRVARVNGVIGPDEEVEYALQAVKRFLQ